MNTDNRSVRDGRSASGPDASRRPVNHNDGRSTWRRCISPLLKSLVLMLIELFLCVGTGITLLTCGGDPGNSVASGGGMGGTGVVAGEVSAVGSVAVNGVHFETTDAKVYINSDLQGTGDRVVRRELATGMRVRVVGAFRDNQWGDALSIFFSDNLFGPVSNIHRIDDHTVLIEVLKHTVIVDALTQHGSQITFTPAIGDTVQVSGEPDELGRIRATWAVNREPDNEVRVRGTVENLNTAEKTFHLNNLTVDYTATDTNALPENGLANSLVVKVRGTSDDSEAVMASRITTETDYSSDTLDRIEISGYVSAVGATGGFTLEGFAVETDADTVFSGGIEEDIRAGVRVEVEGALTGGTITVDRIRFLASVKLESTLNEIDRQNMTLTLVGLDGIDVFADALTQIIGHAATFDDIPDGSHITVRGRSIEEGTVYAVMIQVLNTGKSKAVVQGEVLRISDPTLNIIGFLFDTTPLPENGFSGPDDIDLNREAFFNLLKEGDLVRARGTINGAEIQWNRITRVAPE